MRIWGDITDAAGLRLGKGPVWSLKSATVTRSLDKAGSLSVSAPGTEERAKDLLTNEHRITVYTSFREENGQTVKRTVGSGILRDIQARISSSAWTLTADGPTLMDELKRKNTLLARLYSNVSLGQIASDLAGLAGWTVSVDPLYADKRLYDRFEGVSALKALQKLVERQGLHLREGVAARSLEIGVFGAASGVRLVNAMYAPQEINRNTNVMLISTFGVSRMSEHIINWLVPVGGGEGESAVTLEHCTRLGPYPVRTVTVNGKVHYSIADDASIALYGQIEKVGTFKDIVPISNSDADLEAAANALYDAAVAFLLRNKERLDTYSVTVKKVRRTLNPGDKVRLVYKGFVTNEKGILVNYVDVNEDVWIMRVSERIGLEGITLTLDVTNIDQEARSAGQIIIGAIEAIQMQDLRVQPYPSGGTFVYRREMDATHTAIVPIEISNAVLYLNQARLFIKTRPFRTTAVSVGSGEVTTSAGGAVATSSAAGGNHFHKIASWVRLEDSGVWGGSQASVYSFAFNPTGGAGAHLGLPIRGAGDVSQDMYTEGASGNHAHTITIPAHTHTVPSLITDFGISDDDQFPNTLHCAINGMDATATLGGPWAAGGAEVDTSIDITSYLVNASGGLRRRHEVTFSCVSGQGEIEVTVELRTTVQSISVQ